MRHGFTTGVMTISNFIMGRSSAQYTLQQRLILRFIGAYTDTLASSYLSRCLCFRTQNGSEN